VWCGRWDRPRRDSGASGLEYAALVLVSALLITGLVTATTNTVSPQAKAALCRLFHGGCSATGETGSSTQGGTSTTTGNGGSQTQNQGNRNQGGGPGSDEPNGWDPKWNQAYTGMSPAGAAWRAFGDQVNGFLGGIGDFIGNASKGVGGGIWDDLVGLKDLVVHPIDSVKGIWWAITNPTESIPQLVWDDKSREEWDHGSKTKAVFRGIWNVGSWFIPGYDIGKGISKIGKFGKLADKAGKAGKLAKLAKLAREAETASERARKLAEQGDIPGARKAAEEAKRKAEEARKQAKDAGCKATSLGPPGRLVPGAYAAFGRMGGLALAAKPKTPCENASDAQQARERADRAVERAQLKKDIDDAIGKGRFEDADNLIDKAQANADAARAAAEKNPTKANKDAANQAQKDVDALRNKAVDAKIDNKMKSPKADDKLEATTAKSIRGIVRNVDRKYGKNGADGQVDIETNKFVVEVSNGQNAGKVTQVKQNLGNPKVNPSGKPIIVYAPKWSLRQVKVYADQGITVVRTEYELKKYLREHGENL
jgi:hypothetical protein